MFRRFPLLLVSLFLVASQLCAQNDGDAAWRETMEQWADYFDEENIPEDMVDMMHGWMEYPINLNDTASQEFKGFPFLSDFQREALRAYIAQNGQMASIAELHFINGFDSLAISRLSPFVTVEECSKDDRISFSDVFKHGNSNLRFGAKTLLPSSRGYNEDIYAGDPFRYYFRYLFKYRDRVAFQFSGDKDAGELSKGFDYYGYYLMLNDFGRLRRAVVGKYHLQFGQGATLWTGYAPWMSPYMPHRRYGQGIRPSSAFCEYGYLRGAAATVSLLPKSYNADLELTLFYSNTDNDATASKDSLLDGFQSFYTSGYHRTDNEIMKKGQLNEQLFGYNLHYQRNSLSLGTTLYASLLESPIIPADYVYNYFAFKGSRNVNTGVDFVYRHRRLLFFGEMSMADNMYVRGFSDSTSWLPLAAVVGGQFQINADNLLSVVAHYGSPTYQNLHSNTVGPSSSTQNVEGVACYFSTVLPGHFGLQTVVDIFRYPWMRYRVYAPSSGCDMRLKLSKDIARKTTVDLQYRYRTAERNSDLQLYSIEDIVRRQMYLSLDYHPGNTWRFLSRIAYSWFSCTDHDMQNGFLMFQDVSYNTTLKNRPLSLSTRLALFDVSDYDARIYAYESDLMYDSWVPMYNGRGIRCSMVVRHDLSSQISLAVKYAASFYPDQESIGSGYDITEGPLRQEFKVQMRLKF